MLVKDIELTHAILDLVDNAVDGARRIRGASDYKDLYVSLDLNEDRFLIEDNCGGMSYDVAKSYAFRFGRPDNAASTPGSIGQFGVGMKRALFKIGEQFTVESTAERSKFRMNIDVKAWLADPDPHWTFPFETVEEFDADTPVTDRGTTLTVRQLHTGIAEDFELDTFKNSLIEELRRAHVSSLEKGLGISLNGLPIDFRPLELLSSPELKPAFQDNTLKDAEGRTVRVRLYAGLGPSEPSEAGWYVFCNSRMIIGPDRTEKSGWGDPRQPGVPQFHNQYARFRGFAFLDSDDLGALPWNTTKTALDADHKMYRGVKSSMIALSQPVIVFLNRLKDEPADGDNTPLSDAVQAAGSAGLPQIKPATVFAGPAPLKKTQAPKKEWVTISYERRIADVDQARKVLGAISARAVGQQTFDYFIAMECND